MPVSPIWRKYTTCGELTSTTYIPVGVSINDAEGNENILIISLHNRPGAGVALKPWIASRFRLVLSSSALKIKRLAPAPAEAGIFPIAVNQYVTDL